ncbi:MAG: transcriptional regulator [Desulfuromonas sp.]|uniref:transcriptional regulator n=1 Tax=Desulfuromonas sp. TaxID=892 RepID=UPI000CB195B5|nr:transcriptional regulator [Desulfuromonas sp.]PLX84895.1 MAG: transcriptional regulator [Desulfuromonas sp.]
METKPKPATVPPLRRDTLRRQLLDLLEKQSLNSMEISAALGIAEKEVFVHLEHVQHTLRNAPRQLRITPAACRQCGFVFRKRERLKRPGKCPLCRAETISQPLFTID